MSPWLLLLVATVAIDLDPWWHLCPSNRRDREFRLHRLISLPSIPIVSIAMINILGSFPTVTHLLPFPPRPIQTPPLFLALHSRLSLLLISILITTLLLLLQIRRLSLLLSKLLAKFFRVLIVLRDRARRVSRHRITGIQPRGIGPRHDLAEEGFIVGCEDGIVRCRTCIGADLS